MPERRRARIVAFAAFAALVVASGAALAQLASPLACTKVQAVVMPPARLPAAVWDAMPSWTARIGFAVDGADGSPRAIETTAITQRTTGDRGVDEALLRRATIDAFRRYRFCMPGNFDPKGRYSARLRFEALVDKDVYLQGFEPAYAAQDLDAGRRGRVVVKATFGVDGVPVSADVVSTSGDKVLDEKATAAVMSERVVTHDGNPLARPLTFDQPFNFEIN